MISLAEYAPALTPSQKNTQKASSLPLPKTPTTEVRPLVTPRVSPERLSHNPSSVRPTVAPSDLNPPKGALLHSFPPLVAANDSPHDTLFRSQSTELTNPVRTSQEINGATLGRIRAMIENYAYGYPEAGRIVFGTVRYQF